MKKTLSILLCFVMVAALSIFAFAYQGENYIAFSTAKVNIPKNEHIAGDSNGDGAVNMLDVMATLKYVSGNKTSALRDSIDTNNDGTVNVKDILLILQHVLGDDAGLGELVK